jgi:hypothetical protein
MLESVHILFKFTGRSGFRVCRRRAAVRFTGVQGWCQPDGRAPTGESSESASNDDRHGRACADASDPWSPKTRKA